MAPRNNANQTKKSQTAAAKQPEEVKEPVGTPETEEKPTTEPQAATANEEQTGDENNPTEENAPTPEPAGTPGLMNFCRAMEAARGGAMLRRKRWDVVGVNPAHAVTIKQGETLPAMNVRGQMRPYTPSIEDAMGEDWYITKEGVTNA